MPESAKECDTVLPEGLDIGLGAGGPGFESLHSDHKSTVILIELRWTFSMPKNRLKSGISAVSAHK